MGSPAAPLTYYQRDQIVIASWRNVGLVHWGEQATLKPTRKVGAMSADLLKSFAKISIVQVIPDNVPTPTDDAQSMFAKMTDSGGQHLACLVYVMSGEGFWSSGMRSYLTNVHWIRHRPFVPRICASIQDVVLWMPSVHTERTGVPISATELEEVLSTCTSKR